MRKFWLWVKQLEGLMETQQPPAKILLFLSYFFCSFGGESLKVNSTGMAWQALLQLHQLWLAALFLAKLCKCCFQLCPISLILRGRILQAWHQPVKLVYCLNLKLLQNCCFFSNQRTWTCCDFVAALLPHKSALPNNRRETGKRLNPNQTAALASLHFLQIHFWNHPVVLKVRC